jgi:hypothetical protein
MAVWQCDLTLMPNQLVPNAKEVAEFGVIGNLLHTSHW